MSIKRQGSDIQRPRPPKLKLVESQESSEDATPQAAISLLQEVAERAVETPYYPTALNNSQARSVINIIHLAQELVSPNARCFLIAGGSVEYPANQQGLCAREIFAQIPVTPDLETLVANRFSYREHAEFGLKCRFSIGRSSLAGTKISTERVPIWLSRPNALELPWAAFNPAIHSETRDGSSSRVVTFIDRPNIPLHGDSFFLSTSSAGEELNLVGTSPNDLPSQSEHEFDTRSAAAHFYDASFYEFAQSTGPNMYGVPLGSVVSSALSVNIKLDNLEQLSAERYARAKSLVVEHLTTPGRIHAALREIIKTGERLI